MMNFNLYPTVTTAPEDSQVAFYLNVIKSKQQGLKKLEERYKEKYKKYTNILERLTWLNACSSSLSIATGISSVATFSTFISLPVSIPLSVASLTGVCASGIISVLTKKYQKKLSKVTKLTDIITSALAVFDTSISKALKNGEINEEEFNVLRTFHLETLNELSGIDRKMEAENRFQFDESLLEELKKNLGTRV